MPPPDYPPSTGGHAASDDDLELAAQLVALAHEQLAFARRRLYRALDARRAEGGRHEAVCGTPAGYRRHQRAHTAPCAPCMDAKLWEQRRTRSYRRAAARARARRAA